MGIGTSTRGTGSKTSFSTFSPSVLSAAERVTLVWVCGALFPRLEPRGGDDPGLFAADALALGVPAAMEQALASVPPYRRVIFAGCSARSTIRFSYSPSSENRASFAA